MNSNNDINDLEMDNDSIILLSTKLLYLCNLSYFNSCIDNRYVEKEENYIKSLNITNYRIWNLKHHVEGKESEVISQAISGYIPNTCQLYKDKIPFICFRGTVSFHDILADILSIIPIQFRSKKGTKIATTGAGMYASYKQIIDQGLIEFLLDCMKDSKALFITGHSLGGALANLLATELLTDYSDIFAANNKKLWLITFGCPRVWDQYFAKYGTRERFRNKNDMQNVTSTHHKTSFNSDTNNNLLSQNNVTINNDHHHHQSNIINEFKTPDMIALTDTNKSQSLLSNINSSNDAIFKHLRFINDKDIVTSLPPQELPFVNSSTMKIFEIVHGHTKLYHASHQCQIYFLPWERSEWSIMDSETNFNFAPEPDYKDFWTAIEFYLLFIVSLGSIHKTDTYGGYIEKMHNSVQYKFAIEKLKLRTLSNNTDTDNSTTLVTLNNNDDNTDNSISNNNDNELYHSFKLSHQIISSDIPTSDAVVFTLTTVVKYGVEWLKHTYSSKPSKTSLFWNTIGAYVNMFIFFVNSNKRIIGILFFTIFSIWFLFNGSDVFNQLQKKIGFNDDLKIVTVKIPVQDMIHYLEAFTIHPTILDSICSHNNYCSKNENSITYIDEISDLIKSNGIIYQSIGTENDFIQFVRTNTIIVNNSCSLTPSISDNAVDIPLSRNCERNISSTYKSLYFDILDRFLPIAIKYFSYSKQQSTCCYPQYVGAFHLIISSNSNNQNSKSNGDKKLQQIELESYTELLLRNFYKQTIAKTAETQIKTYLNSTSYIQNKIQKIISSINHS